MVSSSLLVYFFKITIYKFCFSSFFMSLDKKKNLVLFLTQKEIFLMNIITTALKQFALKSATCIINCMKLLLEKGFNFRIFC
ncbi:hypothetical protein DN389_15005 [Bacillus sp. AY3-1]|nr:hypothetical protein DN389_15005 [Bacillus sp. AY3-1]PEP10174.1 hypothetical protein CN552_21740 [Bacillus wiedmannii]